MSANVPPQTPAAPETTPDAVQRPAVTAVDVVRLLVEVFALASLAFWGFVAWPFPWNIVVGIGAPVILALVWALFVSPKAVIRVHPFVRAIVELLLYVAVTVVWWELDQPWVGIVFAVIAVAQGVIVGRRRFS